MRAGREMCLCNHKWGGPRPCAYVSSNRTSRKCQGPSCLPADVCAFVSIEVCYLCISNQIHPIIIMHYVVYTHDYTWLGYSSSLNTLRLCIYA